MKNQFVKIKTYKFKPNGLHRFIGQQRIHVSKCDSWIRHRNYHAIEESKYLTCLQKPTESCNSPNFISTKRNIYKFSQEFWSCLTNFMLEFSFLKRKKRKIKHFHGNWEGNFCFDPTFFPKNKLQFFSF